MKLISGKLNKNIKNFNRPGSLTKISKKNLKIFLIM